MDFWNELSLDPETREKRVRAKGDKEANEILDKLVAGKIEAKIDTKQAANPNSDPETLERFMGLGLDIGMLAPKQINHTHKKETKNAD